MSLRPSWGAAGPGVQSGAQTTSAVPVPWLLATSDFDRPRAPSSQPIARSCSGLPLAILRCRYAPLKIPIHDISGALTSAGT